MPKAQFRRVFWTCLGIFIVMLMPAIFEIDEEREPGTDSNSSPFPARKPSILCEAKERKRKHQGASNSASTGGSKTNPGISFDPLPNQPLMVDTRALPPQITYFDVVGPFPVGKTEYDGDPLEAYGGIYNVTRPPRGEKEKFLSEFGNGGYVSWKRFVPNQDGWVELAFPDIQWQFLVTGLNSITVLEFQAWAVADFYVDQPGRYFLHCDHVHTVELDKATQFYHGDIYGTNMPTVLSLSKGVHTLRLRIKARGSATFRAAFLKEIQPFSAVVYVPTLMPDLVDGRFFGGNRYSGLFSLRILNGHTEPLHSITFKIVSDEPRLQLHPQQPITHAIAPGQVMPIQARLQFILSTDGTIPSRESDKCMRFQIAAFGIFGKKATSGDQQVERQLNNPIDIWIRCRKSDQSFLFGYPDHDGSISYAGALRPWKPCRTEQQEKAILMGSAKFGSANREAEVPAGGSSSVVTEDGCPVLVTLSGVGVRPQNQADSYKYVRKPKGGEGKKTTVDKMKFGFENMWVIAPERDGAHNWEGAGYFSVLSAISALGEMTADEPYKADVRRLIFAGHSRGGHGALVSGIRQVDNAMAVSSAAGWFNREYYGDANIAFDQDVSMNYMDPALKAILEATIVENDVAMNVDNLKGVPVLARVGGADSSVSPWHMRRYARLLHAAGANLTWSEVPNQSHWWWDSVYPNDGGVVFDAEMRRFFSMALTAGLPTPPPSFKVVTYNPATTSSRGGIKILQLKAPFRKGYVHISKEEDKWAIVTSNVQRFKFYPVKGFGKPSLLSVKKIVIDSTEFAAQEVKHELFDRDYNFYWDAHEGKWRASNIDGTTFEKHQRGPRNYGPMRQIFHAPFAVVPGTKGGSKEENEFYNQVALYVANSHYLSFGALAPVIPDNQLDSDTAVSRNLFLIGLPSSNLWIDQLASTITPRLSVTSAGINIELGACNFSTPGIGMVFLSSQWDETTSQPRLRGILTGTDMQGVSDIAKFFFSSNLPLTRAAFTNMVPDYLVIHGPTFRAQGYGGVLAAGFFGNQWEWRRDVSYMSCI